MGTPQMEKMEWEEDGIHVPSGESADSEKVRELFPEYSHNERSALVWLERHGFSWTEPASEMGQIMLLPPDDPAETIILERQCLPAFVRVLCKARPSFPPSMVKLEH